MGVPSGQTPVHIPFTQVWPAGQHVFPQITALGHPQVKLAPVVARQVKPGGQHTGPHATWLAGHAQVPLTHAVPGRQTLPQVPQLALSLLKSTQVVPQSVRPLGQPHCPFTHA
jgi:hypothetical protein